MIKLIGVLVVAVGFALRLNTLLVVVGAGLATGLAAGVPFNDIVAQFGTFFVDNRSITMPILLMVPLIGLLEHHGLRERAEMLIRRAKAATAGRVLLTYSVVRQISISLGVRIGEHVTMVRPLIVPMAEGAAEARYGTLSDTTRHQIRSHASAAENVGNFFGEDIFVAVGAVLLMNGFFQTMQLEVSVWAMALWGLPTAVIAFLVMWWRLHVLDRRIAGIEAAKGGKNG